MDFEFEFINEKVMPKATLRKGKYIDVVREWLETDNKTLVFKCKNMTQKKNVCTSDRMQNHTILTIRYFRKDQHTTFIL